MQWNEYFMNLMDVVATKSKDPSTKVGVVIVGPDHEVRSTGYNGFPRGVAEDIPERWERPVKYQYVEHAERNAIYNAARMGTPLLGCTIYMDGFPCCDCARSLIQAGVYDIVTRKVNAFSERADWAESMEAGQAMLAEAGVYIVELEPSHPGGTSIANRLAAVWEEGVRVGVSGYDANTRKHNPYKE